VLQTVLGLTFAGTLGSDRLPSYLKYVAGQRQFCRAHVTRNLLSVLDLATTPAAKRFCREALALDRRLFRLWHRSLGDPGTSGTPLTRQQLIAKVWPIEKRLFALGERYLNATNPDVRNLACAFFVHNPHFSTFVHEDGVAPTNNAAERALSTGRPMAEDHVWHTQRPRRTGRRTVADHRTDLSAPAAERPRVPHGRDHGSPSTTNSAVTPSTASDPLNCYVFLNSFIC
jgi:hypothetical protein